MITAATARRAPLRTRLTPFAILGTMMLVALQVLAGERPIVSLLVLFAISAWVLGAEALLRWSHLLSGLILVIMFVPIRRYALPGDLPFELEPYRVLIGAVGCAWVGSLLADSRVRLRRSELDGPVLAVLAIAVASIAVNVTRIEAANLTSIALKSVTFLLSFAIVFFLITSVVKTMEHVHKLLRVLVGGGTVVAAAALSQLWTGFNPFDHLDRVIPILTQTRETAVVERGGYLRVYASAQHPIALGSMLVLLIPPAIYLALVTRRRHWAAAAALLILAVFATVSRTGVLSMAVGGLVILMLRPRQTLRHWPLLIVAVVAIHFAIPGVLGTFYKSFFPKQGLIAEQADGQVGSSRVASLGPGLEVVDRQPLLGLGYGARVPSGPGQDSFIVDDQWLATAMETGLLGVLAWAWFFVRFLRRMFRAARVQQGEAGWLFVAIAASTGAFMAAMFTYDAFSFIQVTFVFFILVALGVASLSIHEKRLRPVA